MVHRPDWRRVRRASGFDTTATRLSHHRDISDILAEAPCTNKEEKIDDFHGLMQRAVIRDEGLHHTARAWRLLLTQQIFTRLTRLTTLNIERCQIVHER